LVVTVLIGLALALALHPNKKPASFRRAGVHGEKSDFVDFRYMNPTLLLILPLNISMFCLSVG